MPAVRPYRYPPSFQIHVFLMMWIGHRIDISEKLLFLFWSVNFDHEDETEDIDRERRHDQSCTSTRGGRIHS